MHRDQALVSCSLKPLLGHPEVVLSQELEIFIIDSKQKVGRE
jgi:hypothetical protein